MDKQQILDMLWENPIELGKWCGFKDLGELHNKWLKSFLYSDTDQTLQAHRGSYKTTTLSLFFAINAIIRPNCTLLYFRKTGSDVTEIARQTAKLLRAGCFRKIASELYNKDLILTRATSDEIQTNLCTSIRGAPQILGLGIGTSITGKHADIVVTDDIVNVTDRISKAERERTKVAYQELQNIKNRSGRFINSGTPWHEEDCFSIMPPAKKFDCYNTGLMTEQDVEKIKKTMSPSLFAANYELRFIPSEDVIFTNPVTGASSKMIEQGIMHIDSAFYGEDYTAWTIGNIHDGKIYLLGRMKRKSVEDCYPDVTDMYEKYNCSKLYTEDNADKGLVAKQFKLRGVKTVTYHENMNKYIKIATILKQEWENVVFVEGTDDDYIRQICDYYEDAEHDDAPDSAASIVRILSKKLNRTEYTPIILGA